ncbi:hypothetical protein NDU88_004445 [Pleurodeles waltl]|uniref:Uncharacterized protein n=1 Tax=Pleurodeles waltl TaxID=8319 RepID=A0AAV7NM89_PLEWA|nr:hypothetical protein NDU88_004445 [Pleurodeles waltl]
MPQSVPPARPAGESHISNPALGTAHVATSPLNLGPPRAAHPLLTFSSLRTGKCPAVTAPQGDQAGPARDMAGPAVLTAPIFLRSSARGPAPAARRAKTVGAPCAPAIKGAAARCSH